MALLLSLLVSTIAATAAFTPSVATGQEETNARHLRPDGHVAVAWLYGGTSADYRSQIERSQGLSVISPTWWYLDTDDDGAVTFGTDDELVAWAHDRGLAVWPLFGNHIDPDLTDRVLRDPVLRARVVQAVVEEVRRSGVDGVNVDFENLHDDTRFLLTDLVAELKAALPDLIISVDVTAQTDTWVLGNWSTAFDREGLGRVADYVMLMAYDQHNTLRRDGPVAGLQWVADSTTFLMRTVPADRIVLGLPFYSRDWAEDASATDGVALDSTLGMAAMGQRMADRSQSVVYDEVAGQDLHTYIDPQGRPHRVWLEDVASLQRKTDLVAQHGLAGVAAWRAGFEQSEVWTALDQQLGAMPAPVAATGPVLPADVPPTPAPTPAVVPRDVARADDGPVPDNLSTPLSVAPAPQSAMTSFDSRPATRTAAILLALVLLLASGSGAVVAARRTGWRRSA